MADYGFLRFFSSENINCRFPNNFFRGGFMSTAGRFTWLVARLLPPPLAPSLMPLPGHQLMYLIFMDAIKEKVVKKI
jgi:hypothetical protein